MLESNPHSAHVAARLLDFFDSVIPWHRRLWSVGINLSLKEVAETSDAVAEGVISDAAFATLRKTTLDVAHRDPGVDRRHLNGLKQCLMSDVRAGSGPYYALAHMAEVVEQSYLPLWASALGDNTPPEPESAARCIASSLLDLGFSSQYLHKWWSYRIKHEDGIRSIGDLVLEAHEDLVRRSPRAITVFVPFTAVPGTPWSDPVWLDPHSAASWLAVHGFSTGERLGGALLLELTELDAWAAVMRAAEHVDRLNARVALGTDKQLVPVGKAWSPNAESRSRCSAAGASASGRCSARRRCCRSARRVLSTRAWRSSHHFRSRPRPLP